jgi:type II secretory pathway component PulF
MEKIALRFDKELDKTVKRMMAMLTPTILIFLFVIVGVVAVSIVTAIFGAMAGVRSRA